MVSDPVERLTVALADRYTIELELGAGGMATVYLARDLKHERQVAVKVLRPELAAALGPERFLREIRVTANLQHPHILPLYDSGEADGFLYYVMPCVEGESLRDCLNRQTQLAIDEAQRITEQVASALDFAHRHDVIHRDIKPENILLHEGEAMVADFGIALAVSAAGGQRLTETGFSLGTPEYMSPEQATAERVDSRTDTYSLACVLYEMFTGEPPYTGATVQAILAKRFSDPVPSARRLRESIPAPVDSAITRALAKVPADRFTTTGDFVKAFAAEEADVEAETKSIVVLPFENLSPDPDNAFFADGLTEELIAELSGLRELRVISRTSAMQFKNTKKGVPAIARELNVRHVLEGSVRRAGGSVRITAQLIDASTDSHLWAERYTGKLDDIFDLQEQLSRRIVEALRIALTPDENKRLAARPINDLRAYDAWLRAHHEIWKFSREGIERGIRLIHQAQEITGENALLHAALGYIGALSYDFGISHDRETLQRADEHASKALELDPNIGLALYAKGYVRYKEGDLEEGVRLWKRGAELDHNAEALGFVGFVLAEVGKIEEARGFAEEAVALDPLYMFTGFTRGCVDFLDGQFDAAASRFQRVLDDLTPDEPIMLWWLAQAMAHGGRLDEAREVFAEVAATDAVTISDLSELYCRSTEGDRDAVAKLIDEKARMVETAKTDEWFPNFIANCLVLVGDEDGALEWLGRAIDWGFCNYRYLEEYNPFLKPLHGDPRFQRLIDRARQKHEAFDA